jgi:hypothetical protein
LPSAVGNASASGITETRIRSFRAIKGLYLKSFLR